MEPVQGIGETNSKEQAVDPYFYELHFSMTRLIYSITINSRIVLRTVERFRILSTCQKPQRSQSEIGNPILNEND